MRTLRTLLAGLTLALLTAACAQGGYWLPPSAPSSLQVELARRAQSSPTPEPPAATVPVQATAAVTPPDPAGQPPSGEPAPTPAPAEIPAVDTTPILYYAQAADTLPVVAVRFGVEPEEITSPNPLPPEAFLNPGQALLIPRRLANTTSPQHLLPDSEVVYSPSAVNFNAQEFAAQAGGKLDSYRAWGRSTGFTNGTGTLMEVALENSINPRLLLALLEYHSGWVTGQPATKNQEDYPLGRVDGAEKGLYRQLVWTVNQLSIGYYAYREGRLTQIDFPDGTHARMAPDLNAGTAALQYYFAQLYQGQDWLNALDPQTGFPALYARLFGDPQARATNVEPLYPPGIQQPGLILPFGRGWEWSFTGGPHGAWEHEGAYAALDFAPGSSEPGCVKSNAWVVASASGLVVRSGGGLVALDLDGDGHEQTGWVLIYLHVSSESRVPVGSWVDQGDPLGHPSCEGGVATGTHLHIARKYNGEWIPASGPLPFNLGGWISHAGAAAYKGTLVRDGVVRTACTCSSADTFIARGENDP